MFSLGVDTSDVGVFFSTACWRGFWPQVLKSTIIKKLFRIITYNELNNI